MGDWRAPLRLLGLPQDTRTSTPVACQVREYLCTDNEEWVTSTILKHNDNFAHHVFEIGRIAGAR